MLRNLRRHRRGRIRAFLAIVTVGGLSLYGISVAVEQVGDLLFAGSDQGALASVPAASETAAFHSRIERIQLPPAARTALAPGSDSGSAQHPDDRVRGDHGNAVVTSVSARPESGANAAKVMAGSTVAAPAPSVAPQALAAPAPVDSSKRRLAIRLPDQLPLIAPGPGAAANSTAPEQTTQPGASGAVAFGFGPGRAAVERASPAPASDTATNDGQIAGRQDLAPLDRKPGGSATPAPLAATEASKAKPDLRTFRVRIKPGDSLYSILRARGISGSTVPALVSGGDHGKRLKRIRPGESLDLHLDAAGNLQRVDYRPDVLTTVSYRRDQDRFDSELVRAPLERRKAQVSGVIRSSLFMDGQRAGMSDRVVMQMAEIFGWDVDFALDLRAGDRFTVVYEELLLNGRKVRDGNILAAEFVNQGETYRAVRFVAPDQTARYYTPEGLSMRKAFLRTPVKFARISSRFNLARRHPILHKIRAHKGVDYAAPTGTPVKATGDGRIDFIARKRGYGNTVVVRHGSGYSTLYAHLNGFAKGLRQGASVRQGQTLGYVGKTGLATGPHLHYEFRLRGKHKDPLRVKLPKALPIESRLRRAFREQTHKLVAMLDVYSSTSVAVALR